LKNLKRFLHHKLLLSFLINAVMLVLFLAFTRIMYETNDDGAISRLISIFGETSIPYLNALLSGLLGGLQKAVPFCNVFVLYQLVAGYLSFCAITYVFLDKFNLKFSLPASLAVVILFGYNHYALIQYTKTAYLLSIAGFLLLIHALYKKKVSRDVRSGRPACPVWLLYQERFLLRRGSLHRRFYSGACCHVDCRKKEKHKAYAYAFASDKKKTVDFVGVIRRGCSGFGLCVGAGILGQGRL